MNTGPKRSVVRLLIVLCPVILSLIIGISALPKNCELFEPEPGPLSCDAIPNNCCVDDAGAWYCTLIVLLGVGLSIAVAIGFQRHDAIEDLRSIPSIRY